MSRQEDQQAFIALVERFFAGEETAPLFCDEVVSSYIPYVKAFLRNEHFEEDLYPILFAWQDGRMPDREFEAQWRAAGHIPYEQYFTRLIELIHTSCMCYDMGSSSDPNEIDENQLRQKVLGNAQY
jgi:hypothetical protein